MTPLELTRETILDGSLREWSRKLLRTYGHPVLVR